MVVFLNKICNNYDPSEQRRDVIILRQKCILNHAIISFKFQSYPLHNWQTTIIKISVDVKIQTLPIPKDSPLTLNILPRTMKECDKCSFHCNCTIDTNKVFPTMMSYCLKWIVETRKTFYIIPKKNIHKTRRALSNSKLIQSDIFMTYIYIVMNSPALP